MKLCPFLTCTSFGALVVRGRARFPEGTIAPTSTPEACYTSEAMPSSVITWDGESFTARFERLHVDLIEFVDDVLAEAMHEGQRRQDGRPGSGECAWRIDAMTWEASAELGPDDYISGDPGRLIVLEGRPAAVEIESADVEDLRESEVAFKGAFAGKAELGPWVIEGPRRARAAVRPLEGER